MRPRNASPTIICRNVFDEAVWSMRPKPATASSGRDSHRDFDSAKPISPAPNTAEAKAISRPSPRMPLR